MKKFISKLTHYSREILIISMSILLLVYVLKSYKNEMELKVVKESLSTQKKTIDSSRKKIDSLKTEIFILETENTRHEITRDHIFYVYPKVGEEYDYFISHYTE